MIEFTEFVKKAVVFANVSVDVLTSRDYSLTEQCIEALDDKVLETAVIEKVWVSGGVSGNDCYEYLNRTVDSEGEQEIIPEVLGLLRSLGRDDVDSSVIESMVQRHSFDEEPDYYFNYYEYSKVYVNLKALYDKFLVKAE
jgi:hypothetical protein